MTKATNDKASPKKRLSVAKIKKRRVQLRLLYGLEKSWRKVQRDYYPEVSFQTLQAFADRKRDYVPVNEKVREALDIFADPNPYRVLPRWFKRTPEALEYVNTKREQVKNMFDDAKQTRQSFTKG